MDPSAFERFADELRERLGADPRVLGLVLLGSTADPTHRDQWSDHDFWVVTEPGAQASYLEDLAWLPAAGEILLSIRYGPGRRSVLYRDGHELEFAVFNPNEAVRGRIERFAVVLDRGGVAAVAREVHTRTADEARSRVAWKDALPNLCALLWTACRRELRGERLSARRYLDGFAVDCFLDLLASSAPDPAGADALDPRRRFEERRPELAAEILALLARPVPVAAAGLLRLAKREIAPRAPGLAWPEADVVAEWLEAAARRDPG